MKKSTINTIGYSIPLDLTFEILLKLPAKSVLRFKSVSKSWRSIIGSQQFINAFMSQSLSRPRVVLAFTELKEERVLFFSSTHHQSCSFPSSSSMLVAKENTIPKFRLSSHFICNLVRGFLCCRSKDGGFVVCNPTTGQVIPLVANNYNWYYACYMFLGYDPNSDQYKVLRLMYLKYGSHVEHSVCTLGGQRSSHSWRPIKTNLSNYHCFQNGVCVDGVLYYECRDIRNHRMGLGSFDVGSEHVRLIEIPQDLLGYLANYLGKLGVCCCNGIEIFIWVLDDAKNQVWSKKTCVFPSFTDSMFLNFGFAGITASGEIVYVPFHFSDSFELRCYDVENKRERTVRVEGISKCRGFHPSLLCAHVDNIIYL